MAVNEAKLRAFLARTFYDLAAAQSAVLVVIGDRLGLYRAMANAGPLTVMALAAKTGVDEGYLRAWLVNQAAGGYVEYDATGETFRLPEEQAQALAREDSDVFLPGAFQLGLGLSRQEERVRAAFRDGSGVPMHGFEADVADGLDRSFRLRHGAHLLSSWIPALDGMVARLEAGSTVADVGCGRGAAVLLLAAAFPRSRFIGFDPDAAAIELARRRAVDRGLGEAVRFEAASASDFGGRGYDLITSFEVLHEVADAVGAARHVRRALRADGSWLIVEPMVDDRVEDNLHTSGRLVSSVSVLYCLPVTRAAGGRGDGVLRGERWLRGLLETTGFARVRRVGETPFSLVVEARP
jgi:SAM-dependent methyltransferase